MSPVLRREVAVAVLLLITLTPISGAKPTNVCRSYCGNLTLDYPFAVQTGCGHSGFRELLFCVNDVLMFHISSGSYRVLDIDYAYQALTLHEPYMSTCDELVAKKGNGFVLESWRAPYLVPASDNLFMLIGCGPNSPLFQGFPEKHLPCRNVSGMGCDDYYDCPAWARWPKRDTTTVYGTGPPDCCGVSFEAIRAINLTKLECKGYSSAYTVAPLRVKGPAEWAYGIRVSYTAPAEFCQACEATGGTCGYDDVAYGDLCLCNGWNSTTNCDSATSQAPCRRHSSLLLVESIAGILSASMIIWLSVI